MSLSINFEPHSWYKGFAIKRDRISAPGTGKQGCYLKAANAWYAVTVDGMSGYMIEVRAKSLKELRELITDYADRRNTRTERLYEQHNNQ